MNPTQAVCNYALLRFLPYPETGEFVNVGVVVNCLQPCFLNFRVEEKMTARVKALFPQQNEKKFEAAQAAMREELGRVAAMVAEARDPKSCKIAFNEVVRPRESLLRFGEARTITSSDVENLADDLFNRYVRMEVAEPRAAT
ncbi:MAG: DUF3037 domain-containing protein [Luteolibacter sp.]